ncbi:pyridoxamine 5'-phosphate oxidase family protein [Streptomyces sp. NPDC048172]|uniref:pyridoxamine 5'-phosphate oxidase family protein n=1 Tax=Streptomyces sp. NPDC048172 TaxID=3365505 RepID=UPI00372079E9
MAAANSNEQSAEAKPAPRALSDGELDALLREHRFGVLATVKRSGHPHLSTVVQQWDPEERTVRISATRDRLKVRHIRRDPRVALHVDGPDVWSFAVVEGDATVVPDPEGETEDRVTIEVRATRLYGTSLDFPSGPTG